MNEPYLYSGILILSVFISSCSQIMLKRSAAKQYASRVQEYLNPLVITAYILFFGCTFITLYALKVVPLSMSPILEASGYVFITFLSRLFLGEHPSKKKLLGLLIIVVGIMVYSEV